jgi:hypothetical protein
MGCIFYCLLKALYGTNAKNIGADAQAIAA